MKTHDYFQRIKNINASYLPADLTEGYNFVKEVTENHTTWNYYHSDADIKATVDEYLANITDFLKKENSATNEKPHEEVKTKRARSSNTSTKGGAKNTKRVEHIQQEVKFIKRFVALHNKTKSPSSILSFIKSIQRAIIQKLILKTSPLANEIGNIQEKLIKGYNAAKGDLKITINDADLQRLVVIAGGEEVYPSINIMKRYIGLQGKEVDRHKVDLFTKQITNAFTQKKVAQEDPYYEKVRTILQSIKKLKAGDKIKISKAELSGLEGIINGCGCHEKELGRIYHVSGAVLSRCKRGTYSDSNGKGTCSHNSGLGDLTGVLTAEQMANRQFEQLQFTYPWNMLLGAPAKNFSMMLHGEPGTGKTTLLLKFAEYLANNFGSVLYISSEEHDASTLTDKVNELLTPQPVNLDFAPDLETPDLSRYDFIILDSVNDLGLKLDDFKKLRKAYPEAAFILILQHTKDGNYRGGKDWEHDIQIAAKVEDGIVSVYRSRYGVKGSLNFFDHFHTKPLQQTH